MANGTISGIVFEDLSGSGNYAPTDPPLPGFTLNLYDAANPKVIKATTVSLVSGFKFDNLPPATYLVYIVNKPTQYQPTGKSVAGYWQVNLASGQNFTTAYFGQKPLSPTTPTPTPTPIPTPTPTPTPIDLGKIVAGQTGPLVLPKGNYYSDATLDLKHPLFGSNSNLTLEQGMTNFKAVMPGVILDGFVAPKAGLYFEAAAPNCQLLNNILGVGQPNGSVIQAFKTLPGGINATCAGNTVGVTTTVSVYCDQNNVSVLNNVLAGSIDEYAVRFELGGPDGKTMCSGATLSGNTIHDISSVKDAVGIRVFQNVYCLRNISYGDFRWGQVPGTGDSPTYKVGQYASGSMTANQILGNGNIISLIEVYQGVSLLLTGNIITNPYAPAVSADVYSVVTMSDNTLQVYEGSKVWEMWAASSKGTQVNLGGNKTVIIPKAA
jgi:SdrD B-like domain